MKRRCWLMVLMLTILTCSFAAANALKPGAYVGPDARWLQKEERLMSIYSGQISFWSNNTLTVPLNIPKEGLYNPFSE